MEIITKTSKRLKFLKDNNLPILEIISFKNELKEIDVWAENSDSFRYRIKNLIEEIESVEKEVY